MCTRRGPEAGPLYLVAYRTAPWPVAVPPRGRAGRRGRGPRLAPVPAGYAFLGTLRARTPEQARMMAAARWPRPWGRGGVRVLTASGMRLSWVLYALAADGVRLLRRDRAAAG